MEESRREKPFQDKTAFCPRNKAERRRQGIRVFFKEQCSSLEGRLTPQQRRTMKLSQSGSLPLSSVSQSVSQPGFLRVPSERRGSFIGHRLMEAFSQQRAAALFSPSAASQLELPQSSAPKNIHRCIYRLIYTCVCACACV